MVVNGWFQFAPDFSQYKKNCLVIFLIQSAHKILKTLSDCFINDKIQDYSCDVVNKEKYDFFSSKN